MHVIIMGGPLPGSYKYIGMFASISEATMWATDHLTEHNWVVTIMDKATFPAL